MQTLQIGKILAHHGIAGWLKVYSYGRPVESILQYSSWIIDGKSYLIQDSKRTAKGVLVKFADLECREDTQNLIAKTVYIDRQQLLPTERDEYYWTDLIGLRVVNEDNVVLGTVEAMLETGANDVVQIKGVEKGEEILIPWGKAYIMQVDLTVGEIRVHWHPDYND